MLGLGRSPGEGIGYPLQYSWASLVAQKAKNTPSMRETWVQSLGSENPLEEGMATHSSILAWRIPMHRGDWWAAVHGVAKSQTRLSDSAQNSMTNIASQVVLVVKNPQANAGDVGDLGSIPGPERSSGGGHSHPPQNSCLENPMDKGAWWATSGKEPACQCRIHKRCEFDPWVRRSPGGGHRQPTPVFLPRESHGQRRLMGYFP